MKFFKLFLFLILFNSGIWASTKESNPAGYCAKDLQNLELRKALQNSLSQEEAHKLFSSVLSSQKLKDFYQIPRVILFIERYIEFFEDLSATTIDAFFTEAVEFWTNEYEQTREIAFIDPPANLQKAFGLGRLKKRDVQLASLTIAIRYAGAAQYYFNKKGYSRISQKYHRLKKPLEKKQKKLLDQMREEKS